MICMSQDFILIHCGIASAEADMLLTFALIPSASLLYFRSKPTLIRDLYCFPNLSKIQ